MKKITSLILAGALLASLTACSSKGKSSDSVPTEPVTKDDGRSIITMAVPVDDGWMTSILSEYNKSQKEYQFEIVDYSKKTGRNIEDALKDHYREEVNMLKLDLISGDAPDIIAVEPDEMLSLVRTGMFTDLYELMDGGTGMKREDFLPNVLEGFEADGKIQTISTDFIIKTAIAKTKFVGKDAESWTMDRFLDISKALPEGMQLMADESMDSYNDADSVFSYAAKLISDECIDQTGHSCDFNAPSFRNALEFAGEFPAEVRNEDYSSMSHSEQRAYNDELMYMIKNDKALIKEVQLSFDQGTANEIWELFGEEDLTFVGYPSENRSGASTYFWTLYGIPESTGNKAAAWDALSFILDRSAFSRSKLAESYNAKDPDDIDSVYSSVIGRDRKTGKLITQERVDQLYDYIQSVKISPYRSRETDTIISEEASYVLHGERTPDQCIEILNDRIGTYLAENE